MKMGSPTMAGLAMKSVCKNSSSKLVSSEYFLMNELRMAVVEITVHWVSARIFCSVPPSWSAWQCVTMTASISLAGMP